ncbi:ABC transporter permease [Paraflavitalea speifideaquila]|uniref:ABC transporter permease n=1 Tax=Paraflavitalea speifideaquila TaxID=3076558 RepID=UPI0028EBD585|nr:ABC transporter permease [Paraflavitalea speifideiaquila]
MKDEFPEVEAFVRVCNADLLVRRGDMKFQEGEALYVDSAFFQVFDFTLLKGNPKTALSEIMTVVLSQRAAQKYFGNEDPMGKTLLFTSEGIPATVTGLMKDMPENSQVRADMLVSMSTLTKKI